MRVAWDTLCQVFQSCELDLVERIRTGDFNFGNADPLQLVVQAKGAQNHRQQQLGYYYPGAFNVADPTAPGTSSIISRPF